MKRPRSCIAALALSIVFSLGVQGEGRADFIPWTYSTSTTTAFNEFGNDAVYPPGTDPTGIGGPSVGIAFSEVAPPVSKSGPANILALGLHSWCYADSSKTFTFDPFSSSFTLTFHLTDTKSNANGTLDFAGHFSGSISDTKTDALYVLDSPKSQSLFLAANRYTIAIGPYVVPNPPDTFNTPHPLGIDTGSIGASVDVQPASQAPAPSTLALAGMGLGCVAAARLLRRRWRRPALATPCGKSCLEPFLPMLEY